MNFCCACLLLMAVLAVPSMQSQTIPVAATPPMGWNSWDAYGLTITEDQFRANVKVLATELKPFGYNYAVIDEGWFFFNPQDRPHPDTLVYAIDANGRYVPVPARFPSATASGVPRLSSEPGPPIADAPVPKLRATVTSTSFKSLADYVHAQGLKFGIHIVRGIPRASVERNLPIANSAFHATDVADTADACPGIPPTGASKIMPQARPGTTHCSPSTPAGESICSKSTASPTTPTRPPKSA